MKGVYLKVLLTNDDGIHAKGLRALFKAMPPDVETLVVAPSAPCSASGHAISLYRFIHVKRVAWEKGSLAYAVKGMPVDCVKFALAKLGFRPNLLISGINLGPNTGVSVFYSGTVSAAREGVFTGITAMAVSMAGFTCRSYEPAAAFVRSLLERGRYATFPPELMLNINVPVLPAKAIKGVKITRQAPSRFIEDFIAGPVSRENSFKLVGSISVTDPDGTTDEEAVREGYISVTPLHVDLTAYHEMDFFKRWYRGSKPINGMRRARHGRNAFKLY